MALGDILTAIRAEGDAESAQIERQANAEREAALAAAHEESQREQAEAQQSLDRQIAREVDILLAAARAEAAGALRAGREAFFQRALAELRRRLEAFRQRPDYGRLLQALLREARAALPEGRTLHVDPRDAAGLTPLLRELEGNLRVEADLVTWGGVSLVSDDGRALDNRLETRLERAEPLLRQACGVLLARLLPGSRGEGG